MPRLLDLDCVKNIGNSDICLIGFMGSGKTFIGGLLADELGFTLIDTDRVIETTEQMPIYEIFRLRGEKYFRQVERNILKDIVFGEHSGKRVISMGGGMPISRSNRKLISQFHSINICLNPPFEVVLNRIKGSRRPLVYRRSRQSIFRLWLGRYKIYQTISHITISADNTNDIFTELNKRITMWQVNNGKI